jgi:MFS family permease
MKNKLFKPYLIVILAALFYTYEYLLRIEPSVMVKYLMNHYHIGPAAFAAMVSMYYYAYTPLQLAVGVMTDRYGPRKMLISALITCLVGIFLFVFNNYYVACLARLLMGAGSAFAFVGSVKLAAMWLPSNRFALFAGFCTSLGMLGAVIGDITLSWGIQQAGVSSILHMSFWAGVVLLLLFIFFLENKKDYSASESESNFKAVFKSLHDIMKRPEFWFVGLMGAVLYLSLSGLAELWGVNYLEVRFDLSKTTAASMNALIFVGWLVGSPLMGWLSDKIRMRVRMLMIGCFSSAIIGFIILWAPIHQIVYLHILYVLFGITSSTEVLVFAYARDQVGPSLMATAASFMNLIVMCSGMLAQPLVGGILNLLKSSRHTQYDATLFLVGDYQIALSFVPVMMLVGGVLGLIWYINHNKQVG